MHLARLQVEQTDVIVPRIKSEQPVMRRTIVSLFFNNAFSACFFMQGDVSYTSTIVNANIRDGR